VYKNGNGNGEPDVAIETSSIFDSITPYITERPKEPLKFSDEAQAVFNAGRELWKYYHQQASKSRKHDYDVNASFYDIREFFQGRDDKGKMKNKSNDDKYNELINNLRTAHNELGKKIEPKVYEYGFLL